MGNQPFKLMKRKVKKREWLFQDQDGRCYYCLTKLNLDKDHKNFATLEHIVKKADGGTLKRGNIVVACKRCNAYRQNIPSDIWKIIHKDAIRMHQTQKIFLKQFKRRNRRKLQRYRKKYSILFLINTIAYRWLMWLIKRYYKIRLAFFVQWAKIKD